MPQPDRQRRDWDLHAKRVVRAALAEVIALTGVDVDASELTPRTVELPASSHRADLLSSIASLEPLNSICGSR